MISRVRMLAAGLAMALVLTLTATVASAQGVRWNNPPGQPTPGIEHGTFHSAAMDTAVGYSVMLPRAYSRSDARYPAIYYLHGLGGNETQAAGSISRSMRSIFDSDGVAPAIVVFVNGGASSMYADSADGAIKAETAIVEELIPHIDATYRTIAEREGRAIQGFSMGGYGALMLGAKHPELFSSVLSYAGALHDEETLSGSRREIFDAMFGDAETFRESSPYEMLRRNADRIRGRLPLRLVVGTVDPTLGYNETYRALLAELNIAAEYVTVQDIGHNIRDLYREMGLEGLRFHAKHFGGDGFIRP